MQSYQPSLQADVQRIWASVEERGEYNALDGYHEQKWQRRREVFERAAPPKKPAPRSRPQPGLLEFGCDRGPASCFFSVLSGSLMSKEFKINQRSRLSFGVSAASN